jgi:DNA-binding CsgD family transcriptional regulator
MSTFQTWSLSQFSAALEELYQPLPLEEFPDLLFKVVTSLIPDVGLTFDQLSKRTGAMRHSRNFEAPNPQEWLERLAVNVEQEHPIIPYVLGGGKERVLRLSDFMTQRQFKETNFYAQNAKPVGMTYQISVLLPIPGYVAGLTLNRHKDFHDDDMDLLRLLMPHIVRAHANAELFSALRGTTAARTAPAAVPAETALTPREEEVLHWLSQGKRDREIAIILGISHKTVGKHVERILAKLGTETRGAAAAQMLDPGQG